MLDKILKTLLSSLCITMCLLYSRETGNVTYSAQVYFNKFVNIAKECMIPINSATVRIEMSDRLDKKHAAVCYYLDNIIQINNRTWNRLTDIEREQLIFHELGHCLLDEEHDDDDLNIMNSIGFIDEENYKFFYNFYIRRLFKDCKKPLFEKFNYDVGVN